MSNTKNNHYIAQIQTKDWLENHKLYFFDFIKNEFSNLPKKTMFADFQIFPQEFEDFLKIHIEDFLGKIYHNNLDPSVNIKAYRSLWLLTKIQNVKTNVASHGGREFIPDELYNKLKDFGTINIQVFDNEIYKNYHEKNERLLILESSKELFFCEKGVFPFLYSFSRPKESMFKPSCVLCYPISKRKVVCLLKKDNIQYLLNFNQDYPENLRKASITSDPLQLVYSRDELLTANENTLLTYLKNIKNKNKQLTDLLIEVDDNSTSPHLHLYLSKLKAFMEKY